MKYLLKDICNISAGGDVPKGHYSLTKSSIYSVPIYSNGIENEGLYGYTDKAAITDEAITISARGTIGITFRRTKPYYPIVRLISLIPKKSDIDLDYLYYALKLYPFKKDGSVQQQLTVPMVGVCEVDLPDLPTQKRIASVLSNIDRKIALNRAMNEELEQTARDLYDYWFLQFDFPDANGKPYRSSGGKMVYNATLKREIPEGWEVKQIEDFIAEYKSGDWGAECPDSSHTLKIGSVRGADIVSMENLPIRYISDKHSDRLLKAGDIIVEISGGSPSQSTGRTAFISQTLLNRFDTPIDCTNFCQAISPIKNYELFLYYMWNAMYDNGNMFNFEGKTSGLKNFLMPRFVTNLWFKPSSNVVVSFNEIIQPMIDQKQINIKEINHLRSLRDELLPLLMNGQVEVKE